MIVAKKYDPLYGRYIREMRSDDIVHISAPLKGYSAGTIAFTTLDDKTELFITSFSVSSTTGGNNFFVLVNSSTILPISLSQAGEEWKHTGIDAPFARCAANSTISICIGSAGTVCAFLTGVRFPTIDYVETQ